MRRKCLKCSTKHGAWTEKMDGYFECGKCGLSSRFKSDSDPTPEAMAAQVPEVPIVVDVHDSSGDDIWHMKLPFQAVEGEAAKNFSQSETTAPLSLIEKPTRVELEEAAERIDNDLASSLDRLRQIRDNRWWEICDCKNFSAFCHKYLKKTGRRVEQMLQAEQQRAGLAPEVQRFFKGAAEVQIRIIASVPVEKQDAVVRQALAIARERPDPVGEAAKWRSKDEEGNFVPKVTAADLESAKVIVLTPPPPITETLFDQELRTGKPADRPKPELPAIPTNTAPPDDSDFAQTEAEALAIVRGEVIVDLPPRRPDDISTFTRPDTTEDTEEEAEIPEDQEGPDIRILRCTPNVTAHRYDREGGKIILRVEFAKANFPVVVHIGGGIEE